MEIYTCIYDNTYMHVHVYNLYTYTRIWVNSPVTVVSTLPDWPAPRHTTTGVFTGPPTVLCIELEEVTRLTILYIPSDWSTAS